MVVMRYFVRGQAFKRSPLAFVLASQSTSPHPADDADVRHSLSRWISPRRSRCRSWPSPVFAAALSLAV
ncbi:hypothetical protein HPP92_015427 [Vanilla planifolia]|uniref:Uncharacterized protein n=1 Tax=Vanilla planifolia TaxID=51239 RepID=A0A835QHV1_VANPL|nr:hypothetical protein HPP92_015427 [Vanilla planifolia]